MARKLTAVIAALLALCMAFAGCAKKSTGSAYYEEPRMYEAAAEEAAVYDTGFSAMAGAAAGTVPSDAPAPAPDAPMADPGAAEQADASVRKLIYDASLSVTVDRPEETLDALTELAAGMGGYLSENRLYNDDDGAYKATATLKVPAARLDELLEAAKGAGKVTGCSVSGQDITMDYYDIQARLTSAKAEEQQLLRLYEKCESVEEMLSVRDSLARVRSDIEVYEGRIRLWDNLVAYATLRLTINRTPKKAVEKENEDIEIWKASDVGKRMAYGFRNTARWLVNALYSVGIFLAYAALPLLAVGLIVWAVVAIRRKTAPARAKRREKKAAKAEARREAKRLKKERRKARKEEKK